MMKKLPFNTLDSWAFWDIPSSNIDQLDDEERQTQFGEIYKANHFPKEQLPENLV
ncbi:hypothetical protein PS420_06945 [Pediococcus acidilactici]